MRCSQVAVCLLLCLHSWCVEVRPPCDRNRRIPNGWSQDGKDLLEHAYNCTVRNSSSVNVLGILNITAWSTHRYVSGDVYFNCTNPTVTLDFSATPVDKSVVLALRMWGCAVTWDAISSLGKKVHLVQLQIEMEHTVMDLSPHAITDVSGLSNLGRLHISFTNISQSDNVTLSQLLPSPPALDSVYSFTLSCHHSRVHTITHTYCDENLVTYNTSDLQHTFPRLQSLVLFGVYPLNHTTPLEFPWYHDLVHLPLNLSRSRFWQRDYANGKYITEGGNVAKTQLSFYELHRINMTAMCPSAGHVSEFDYVGVSMREIPGDCFHGMNGTTGIDLSQNHLTTLPGELLKGMTTLETLYITSNELCNFENGTFNDLINLKFLSLQGNNLTMLRTGEFSNLLALQEITVSFNKLENVSQHSLPAGSHNLTYVNFGLNHLTTIPRDCISLPRLQICELELNHITLHDLKELVKHFHPIEMYMVEPLSYYGEAFNLYEQGYVHTTTQSEIRLNNNSISQIPFNESEWTEIEKKQLAAFLSFFFITFTAISDNDSMRCDCNLYEFRKFIGIDGEGRRLLGESRTQHLSMYGTQDFSSWLCQTVEIMGGQVYSMIEAPGWRFACHNSSIQCPENCICYTTYEYDDILVDCSSRNHTVIPTDIGHPTADSNRSLTVSLKSNEISQFPRCDLHGYEWLAYVTSLDLSNNSIVVESSVELERFLVCLKAIKYLYLSGNQIRYIAPSIRRIEFQELILDRNDIDCCNAMWLKLWLQTSDYVLYSHNVFCSKPKLVPSHPIVELYSKDFFCLDAMEQQLVLGLSILVALTTLVILATVCYWMRGDIKILLFAKFGFRPWDNQKELSSAIYDVYLMYCDRDYLWSQQTLLDRLESNGFRVFDKNRDTMSGPVEEQLETAFSLSRRVVVVLSGNFFLDGEIINEFYRADTYSTEEGRSRYIIVVKLTSENNSFMFCSDEQREMFGKYLRTNYYADVSRLNFWSRLYYWLPALTLPERENSEHGSDSEEQCVDDTAPLLDH